MNVNMMVMIALISKNGRQESVAIPNRVKVLTHNVRRIRAMKDVTPQSIFNLLRDNRAFNVDSESIDDLMYAMEISVRAGYTFSFSYVLLRDARIAGIACRAKPELYATGKEIGAALEADRINAIQQVMLY